MCAVADRRPRVPVGEGVLHSHRVKYSPETHNLLKVLMAESRLTMLQRRKLNDSVQRGAPLPAKPPLAHEGMPLVPHGPQPVVRIGYRRPRDVILHSGAYERDPFVPSHPRVDKEREKHSFQDRMAFGKDMPPTPRRKVRRRSASLHPAAPEPDRFEELVNEVDDRVAFLRDMEALGQGQKYRQLIQQEIAAKVREMEALDKQRCTELENLANQLETKL